MKLDVDTGIKEIKNNLRHKIGESKYQTWFAKSHFCVDQDRLKVLTPNSFINGMIRKNYYAQIDDCVKNVLGSSVEVVFDVSEAQKNNNADNALQRRSAMPLAKPIVIDAEPFKQANKETKGSKHTLDNFVVGNENKMAYSAAQAVANLPGKSYNPLFLYGGYGLGKTHLLHAICNQSKANKSRANCVYISAESFTNQYVSALRSSQIEKFRTKYRNVDILAIDDIHFLANKTATQEEFLHTFNSIELADKQIVLASDAHPTMIASLAENLVNRFVSGMVIEIKAPDYQTRLEICRRKIEQMQINIPDDVVHYVAENITTSVRDIEGALFQLNAQITFTGERLTVASAAYMLGSSAAKSAPRIRVGDIESSAAAFFGIPVKSISSSKRDKTTALCRFVVMYLVREYTTMSFPEIAKALGGKSHATVISGCKKIKAMIEKNALVSWKHQGVCRSENINAILKQLKDAIVC